MTRREYRYLKVKRVPVRGVPLMRDMLALNIKLMKEHHHKHGITPIKSSYEQSKKKYSLSAHVEREVVQPMRNAMNELIGPVFEKMVGISLEEVGRRNERAAKREISERLGAVNIDPEKCNGGTITISGMDKPKELRPIPLIIDDIDKKEQPDN